LAHAADKHVLHQRIDLGHPPLIAVEELGVKPMAGAGHRQVVNHASGGAEGPRSVASAVITPRVRAFIATGTNEDGHFLLEDVDKCRPNGVAHLLLDERVKGGAGGLTVERWLGILVAGSHGHLLCLMCGNSSIGCRAPFLHHLRYTTTGQFLQTLTGHPTPVTDLVFSPDEQLLATASREIIRLWNLPDGRLLHALTTIGDSVLAFSPDGTLLAAGDGAEAPQESIRMGSYVFLWDPHTATQVGRTMVRHSSAYGGTIERVRFSTSGQILGASDSDGLVHVWAVTPIP
jgi:hypothetical protein